MARQQSVISLDAIDRKKEKGFFGRLMITRYGRGRPVVKSERFGHYMFCGEQGSGKTSSALWYAEFLARRYKKRKLKYQTHDDCDDLHTKCKTVSFKEPPKVKLYSNIDIGRHIDKKMIFETIDAFDPYANEVRIVYIDEIHGYFPKDSIDKETKKIMEDLLAIFSQLRKRNTYILSTAQIYGRLHKSLREQCLFMVDCKVGINNKLINDFIKQKDIIADDLGRWAGNPSYIIKHGLPENNYDSKKLIRS